jgi:hypothetical protein
MKMIGNHKSAHSIHSRIIMLPPFILPKKPAINANGNISSMMATKVMQA